MSIAPAHKTWISKGGRSSGFLLVGPLLRLPVTEPAAGFVRFRGLDHAHDVGGDRGPGFFRQRSETRERSRLKRSMLAQSGETLDGLIKTCVEGKDFRLTTIIRVADALEVTLSDLFSGLESGKSPEAERSASRKRKGLTDERPVDRSRVLIKGDPEPEANRQQSKEDSFESAATRAVNRGFESMPGAVAPITGPHSLAVRQIRGRGIAERGGIANGSSSER